MISDQNLQSGFELLSPKLYLDIFIFGHAPFVITHQIISFGAKTFKMALSVLIDLENNLTIYQELNLLIFAKIVQIFDVTDIKSTFLKVLKKNLLSLYIALNMPMQKKRNCLPIANYYLRLAWLFRDIEHTPSLKEKYSEGLETNLNKAKEFWNNIPSSEQICLEMAIQYYLQAISTSNQVNTTAEEIRINIVVGRIYLRSKKEAEAKKIIVACKIRLSAIKQKTKTKEHLDNHSEQEQQEIKKDIQRAKNMLTRFESLYDKIEASNTETKKSA